MDGKALEENITNKVRVQSGHLSVLFCRRIMQPEITED